jgi:diguanylate cyclase (GGDEF)-like protein
MFIGVLGVRASSYRHQTWRNEDVERRLGPDSTLCATHVSAPRLDLMYLRRHLWLVAAACTVVVGSIGSFFAGNVVARNDAQTAHQSFVTSSEEIASTLKLAIQHEQDLVVNAGAFFVRTPDPTETEYQQWLAASRTFAQYPELTGIAQVVVVPASRLRAFEVRALKDPAGTLGANGTFQITPAGARPYYCLANVAQSRSGQSVAPAGFDYCDTILGPEFLKARDSGEGAYLPYGSGSNEILVVGTPIYTTGVVPTTVQARRADFIGWIGTEVIPSELLVTALANHPRTAVAFVYSDHSSEVTFKAGAAPPKGQSTTIQLDNGWRVQTYGALSAGGVLDNGNALTVLLSGLLLSVMLAILIYVLGTGRSRALAMVHERTDQLQHQALHDSLTGLPNRALILDRINQMLARARRDHIEVAVLFLDLDNFKDINDTLGHDAGDQLLVGVGVRLSNVLREADTVGRLGGDEFVILAEGASLAPGAEAVAERIIDVMKAPFVIPASDVPLTVTASIGIAEGMRTKPEELLRDADIAMYRAKSVGKQCAVVFLPSMQKVVDEHRNLGVDLSAGFEHNQFFLLYQPTVDLATGAFTGVEALLRWRHPVRGVVMPDDFIPALEASGLIVPVGLWVLQEACRQGAIWHSQGYRFAVSVNVSVKQLEQDRIVDDVRAALLVSGFDSAQLVLEITETSLMHDVAATIPRLKALKELGLHLAIDDFGTGYSSLAYLRQFPIDILKIDRSFVSGIVDTREAAALVHALVQLGKVLGLETIAEGVETHEQRRQLITEKVDTGQGFLFSRPIDVDAVDQLLKDWQDELRLP